MPRFFLDALYAPGDVVTLADEVARHVQVLRLQPGDPLVVFNGRGGQHDAQLVEIGKRHALVKIGAFSAAEAEPPYRITLAQGIAGGDKMDWLIEKAVELGAARFVPLAAARSVVRLTGERALRRHAHWEGIVRASCEQCGRNRLPEVAVPAEPAAWLAELGTAPRDGELRLMLSPRASVPFAELPAAAPSGDVTLLIGPEGGLTPEEEDAAVEHGFLPLGLGPRVLRTETAGIAVLAALAARWGGW
jgi:16S rRNA (uracil1498-N3)-methyltransferase